MAAVWEAPIICSEVAGTWQVSPSWSPTAVARDTVVFGPTQSYAFAANGTSFTPLNGEKETLIADPTDHLLFFTASDGSVYAFNDFSYSDARAGQFAAAYSAGGAVEAVTATDPTASNQIAEIEWYASASAYASTLPYQTESFTYEPSTDPGAGQLESIVFQGYSGSALVNTGMIAFTYYDGVTNPSNGTAGELESATTNPWDSTLNDGSGGWSLTGESYYYRYYTSGAGGLEMGLTPQAVQNAGGLSAVESTSMTDTALAPYAAEAFQYNALHQVTQATVDGLYSYQYSYTMSLNLGGDANTWLTESVENRSDYSTYTVYCNSLGETLLTDLADTSTGQHWVNYTEYGTDSYDQGLVVLTANPSAINMTFVSSQGQYGYDSSSADLDVHLNSTDCQLTGYVYGASTTAGETTAGDALGYLQSETLYDGTSDTTGVMVESYEYYAHAGSVVTTNGDLTPVEVFPIAGDSTYPDAPASLTPDTTSYIYTWWDLPGTSTPSAQVEQETTILPIVPTSQNGPGGTTPWTEQEFFDASGNLIWEKDADGNLSCNGYDPVTGLLSETIQNVNATTTLPSGVPALSAIGWSFPTPNGASATTDYSYDPLGRVTQVLGPAFVDDAGDTVRTATWTSYLDAPALLGSGRG